MSMCLCRLIFAASGSCCIVFCVLHSCLITFFEQETRVDTKRKVIKSTGVKWRLKFQWQSGSNSLELSPHMSCNLADISRLLQSKSYFRCIFFLCFIVAFKIYWQPVFYQLHPDYSGLLHIFKTSWKRWLYKQLLLTWLFYSIIYFFTTAYMTTLTAYLFYSSHTTEKLVCSRNRNCIVIHLES